MNKCLALLILMSLSSSLAWSTPNCELIVSGSYESAVIELASGYLNIEKMYVGGAQSAAYRRLQKDFAQKRSELKRIIGDEKFSQLFEEALEKLRGQVEATSQNRAQSVEAQISLQAWTEGPAVETIGFVKMSRDGKHILYYDNKKPNLMLVKPGSAPVLLLESSAEWKIQDSAFSKDGKVVTAVFVKLIQSGGNTRTSPPVVWSWDTITGKILANSVSLDEVTYDSDSKLSPDGNTVLTYGNQFAFLWRASTGALLRKMRYTRDKISPRDYFSPDSRFVTTTNQRHVTVWSTETGALLANFYYGYDIEPASFSLGGHLFTEEKLVSQDTYRIHITNWQNPYPHRFEVPRLTQLGGFTGDGQYMLINQADDKLSSSDIWKFINTVTGKVDKVVPNLPWPYFWRFSEIPMSADGRFAVLKQGDRRHVLWDFKINQPIRDFTHESKARSAHMSADGNRILLEYDGINIIIKDRHIPEDLE